jgi:hypothetical protein
MKMLVDYILKGSSPDGDGKSVGKDEEVLMEQEKLQQLCLYQTGFLPGDIWGSTTDLCTQPMRRLIDDCVRVITLAPVSPTANARKATYAIAVTQTAMLASTAVSTTNGGRRTFAMTARASIWSAWTGVAKGSATAHGASASCAIGACAAATEGPP